MNGNVPVNNGNNPSAFQKVTTSVQHFLTGIETNIGLFIEGFNATLDALSKEIAAKDLEIQQLKEEIEKLKKENKK